MNEADTLLEIAARLLRREPFVVVGHLTEKDLEFAIAFAASPIGVRFRALMEDWNVQRIREEMWNSIGSPAK